MVINQFPFNLLFFNFLIFSSESLALPLAKLLGKLLEGLIKYVYHKTRYNSYFLTWIILNVSFIFYK